MKQMIKKLLVVAILLSAFPSWAYDFSVDGIYYTKNSSGNTVYVTYEKYDYKSYSGSVVIPSTVTYSGTTYSVTSIGSEAFYNCSGLTSVTIPNSVTSIGDDAFNGCSGLTSVTIPNSVTSIGRYVFSNCSGLTSVTIGNRVTSIVYGAFWGCSRLTSVTIPNSFTSIGDYAFNGCSGLKKLTIQDGTSTLSLGDNTSYSEGGEGLFYDAPLESVYLGRNLSYDPSSKYGYSPFYGKSTIKELTIGNSVTSIGDNLFRGCSGLTSVTIPKSVTEIGADAFKNCGGLTKVEISDIAAWCKISFAANNGYVYSNPLSCAKHLYLNGKEVINLVIPNSVTSIGFAAFYFCSGLKSVTIPNSVTSIGNWAFISCYALTSITIPNSVTSIGDYAFSGCSGLTSVTIGNSVTSIGKGAFSDCSGLKQITIHDGTSTLSLGYNSSSSSGGEGLFYDAPLESVYLGRNLSYDTSNTYGYSPFYGKSTIKELTIGNSVTSIGDYAFYGCSSLNTIYCSSNPPSLGSNTIPSTARIYVPVDSYSKYESSWSNYVSQLHVLYFDTEVDSELTGTISFSGSGAGTENDPFLIFNPVQLNDVRNSVGHSGVYYKLMSDIDMTEWIAENNPTQGWQPIGNNTAMFKGVFIGNGKRITGLTSNRPTSSYVGLFGYVYNATISDLTVEGNIIGGEYTGGLFGKCKHSTISNCSFDGNVTGAGNTGGFAGASFHSAFTTISQNGEIIGAGNNVGGIFGEFVWSEVDSAIHSGNISNSGQYTGGLIGRTRIGIDNLVSDFIGSTKVTNSKSTGDVKSQSAYVGGLFGLVETRTAYSEIQGTSGFKATITHEITNCTHKGEVAGSYSVGGIAGENILEQSELKNTNSATTAKSLFTGCSHTGNITARTKWGGGIIGVSNTYGIHSSATIQNCHSVGDITVNGSYAGGVLGYSFAGTTTISDCYSLGDMIVSGDYTGGILGKSDSGKTTITDCYYNGKIDAKQYVGGIVGETTKTSIKYSYSNSSLINGTNYVGGLAGHLDGASSISSSVSANEKINATVNNVGRIYGAAESGAVLGATGSTTENKGLATATVNLSGVQQMLTDGLQHGTNVGRSTLRLRSTYQGIGWDFTNKWANQETESYPYKPVQTAPPVIQSVSRSGDTTISGKAASDATVYVTVNGETLTTTASNNVWSVTVDPMQPGDMISVYAIAPELEASYSVYQTVGFAGSGTLEDPYQIYTADDLANVNGTGYYKIMNDIDLSEWIATNSPKSGWEPIGKKGSIMSNLIGDHHVISGLWVDSTDDYVGLMSMAENISITDLTVKVADGKSIKGNDYVSILIGKAVNSSISGCQVIGTVEATGNYVGGIVGNAENTSISGCQVAGTLEATGNYVGGMAGNASQGTIENCTANGVTISGADYAGGLVGKSDAISFTDCSADCTINAKKYVGGLTGIANAAITNSQTKVDITGTNYLGGLCGTTTETITNSFAVGTIVGTNPNTDVCYAGGLVGHSTKDITLSYSKLSVELMSQGTECYVGGITGYNDGALIENCYSTGLTSSSQYAAGIAGYNKGQVNKCYASGGINAFLYGAGIVGYNDGATATTSNCVALNNVIAVSDEAGIAMRVIGGFKNGAPTPEANNIALKTMVVSVNDVTQKIYDDLLHGVGNTLDVLEQSATYTSLGWDFDNIWAIEEGVGYPYLKSSPTEIVPITSLSIAQTEVSLEVSGTLTLTATIEPANATTKDLEWTSSNESVATVVDGVVTAVSAGSATITARTTDGSNLSATCEVTVLEKVTNYFVAQDFKIRPGASYSFPVEMVNENAIAGFQCDIYLPEGISIDVVDDEYDIALTDRMVDHVVFSALQTDGAVRMLSYSMKVKSYTGNSGDLFTVNLTASSDYDGLGTIKISNIIVSTPQEVEYKCPDVMVNVELQNYTLGDVNNDGSVSVTDVISATNYILGSPSSNFIFEAADITGDGKIGVGDVIGIVNRVLNVGTLSAQNASTTANDSLEADDITIEAGETKTVSVNMNNAEVYTGFQFDIKMPNGLRFENAYLSKLANSHKVAFKQREDGTVRVVVFSLTNEDIKQNIGSLLSFDVTADNTFVGGEIEIDNVLFANKATQEYTLYNLPIEVSRNGGVNDMIGHSRVYVENNRIVVTVPESQIVTISSVSGVPSSYQVTAGKNVLPISQSGLYIVKVNDLVRKVIIK